MKFRGVLLLIAFSFVIPDRAEARIFGRMMSRIRQNGGIFQRPLGGGMFRRPRNQGGLFRRPQFVQPQFVQPQPSQFGGVGNTGVPAAPVAGHGPTGLPIPDTGRVVDPSPSPGDKYKNWWLLFKDGEPLNLGGLAAFANQEVKDKPYKTGLVEQTCVAKQGEPMPANLRIFSTTTENGSVRPLIYLEPAKEKPTEVADAWAAAMKDTDGEKAGSVAEVEGGMVRNDNRWQAKNPGAQTQDFQKYEVNLKKAKDGSLLMEIVYKNSNDSTLDYKMYCKAPTTEALAGSATPGKKVQEIIKANCMGCHNTDGKDDYGIFEIESDGSVKVPRQKLAQVLKAIQSQNGKPPKMPQGKKMEAADLSQLVAWINLAQEEGTVATGKQSAGETTKPTSTAKPNLSETSTKPNTPSSNPALSNPAADWAWLDEGGSRTEGVFSSDKSRSGSARDALKALTGQEPKKEESFAAQAVSMAKALAIRQAMGTKQTPIRSDLGAEGTTAESIRTANPNWKKFRGAALPLEQLASGDSELAALLTKLKPEIEKLSSVKGKSYPTELSPIQVHELLESVSKNGNLSDQEMGLLRDLVGEMAIAMHAMDEPVAATPPQTASTPAGTGSPASPGTSAPANGKVEPITTKVEQPKPPVATEKVQGTLKLFEGDLAPTPEIEPVRERRLSGVRVAAFEHVSSLTRKADGSIDVSALTKVGEADKETDKDGKYELALPSGSYTLLYKVNEQAGGGWYQIDDANGQATSITLNGGKPFTLDAQKRSGMWPTVEQAPASTTPPSEIAAQPATEVGPDGLPINFE